MNGAFRYKASATTTSAKAASVRDLDLLTIGMVNDMYAERRNDDYKYREYATPRDFDIF